MRLLPWRCSGCQRLRWLVQACKPCQKEAAAAWLTLIERYMNGDENGVFAAPRRRLVSIPMSQTKDPN